MADIVVLCVSSKGKREERILLKGIHLWQIQKACSFVSVVFGQNATRSGVHVISKGRGHRAFTCLSAGERPAVSKVMARPSQNS